MKKFFYAMISILGLASCAQAQCAGGSCGLNVGFSFGAYSVQRAPVFFDPQPVFVPRQAFGYGYGVSQNVFVPQQVGLNLTINNRQRSFFGDGFGRNRGSQQIFINNRR